MKNFTKLMFALAMLVVGATSVSAQDDEIVDFDASFYHSWSEVSATATDNGEIAGGTVVIGKEVALGGTIWGNSTGAVPYLSYANITEYSELRFEGTPGAVIRLMCNRIVDEGPIYEIKPKIGEDGKLTVKISDLKYLNGGTACDFVCLQGIKVPAGWQGGTTAATITSIKIVKPADPLAIPKESLKNAINEGKKQNAIGKTTASFGFLTTAITDGESEYANASATVESLTNAAKAITDAIAALELEVGYTSLTASMFKTYSSVDADATVAGSAGCAYELFTASGLPYGDGSVGEKNWADLTSYDKIVIATIGSIKPRLCMNRIEKDGNEASTKEASKMIDINDNNGYGWSEEAYLTTTGNIYTVDLKAIVSDWGFARLHSIKKQGWNDGVVVSDLLLYRAPKTATIGATKYATFSADKAVKIEGVDAYVAKLSGSKLVLTKVTEVPAHTGVILNGDADDYNLPVIDEAAAVDNDLKVSDGTVAAAANIYVLADGTKGVGFYQLGSGTVPAGKAYLQLPASSPALEFIGFDMETTGISGVAADVAAAKEGIFNLNGQRVSKATKGLYIVNGKKVLVK